MGRVELVLPLKGKFLSSLLHPQPIPWETANKKELSLFAPDAAPTPEHWCSTGYSVCPKALCQGDAGLSSPCPIPSPKVPINLQKDTKPHAVPEHLATQKLPHQPNPSPFLEPGTNNSDQETANAECKTMVFY